MFRDTGTKSLLRRNFLRGLAASAALPWLGRAGRAESAAAEPGALRLLSANLRVPLPEDDASGHGWAARRDLCVEILRSRRPAVICLQEMLREPLDDLLRALPEFAAFGFEGPEMDARPVGYHGIAKNPILYLRDRFDLVSAGCYWLSETPHLPGSLSWGSARARHANWVRLRDRAARREFRVLNTHLDHVSQPARERQTRLIVEESAAYAADFPQFLAGDFNEDATNPVYGIIGEGGWRDTYVAVHGDAETGFTAHAFRGPDFAQGRSPAEVKGRIDFIFARGAVRPLGAEIIRDRRGRLFPSDHYFVSADAAIG